MANFDDITGFREELGILRKSPVQEELYSKENISDHHHTKFPLSVLLDYAELLLRHDETRNAVLLDKEWEEKKIRDAVILDKEWEEKKMRGEVKGKRDCWDDNYEHDPAYPHQALKLLTDFTSWFILKTKHKGRNGTYRYFGRGLAKDVLRGKYSSVRSPEAVEDFKQQSLFTSTIDITS